MFGVGIFFVTLQNEGNVFTNIDKISEEIGVAALKEAAFLETVVA